MKLRSGKIKTKMTEQGDLVTGTQETNFKQYMEMIINKLDQQKVEITNKLDHQRVEIIGEFKLEINQVESKLNEKINQYLEKADNQFEQLTKMISVVEEQVNVDINQVNQNLQKEINNLEKKFDGQMNEIINPIQNDIKSIKENINKMENTTKSTESSSVGHFIPSVFRVDALNKFYGDNKASPCTFIKNLKKEIDIYYKNMDIKKCISNYLGGDAIMWYEMIEDQYQNFEEFEQIFLKYYWGDHIQSKVRENLINGKYNESWGQSRERYAIRKYNLAKQLQPIMSEVDIIKYISRHYSEEIRNVIVVQDINNINRLLEYLRRLDDMMPKTYQNNNRNQNYNYNVNFKNYKDNRKVEGSNDKLAENQSYRHQNNKAYNYNYNETRNDYRKVGNRDEISEERRQQGQQVNGNRYHNNGRYQNQGYDRQFNNNRERSQERVQRQNDRQVNTVKVEEIVQIHDNYDQTDNQNF